MIYLYVCGPSEIEAGERSTANSTLELLVQTLLMCSHKERAQD